ncbi:uncharacterized protein [Porites lutea]|uniref:uncharacterized protein isoform X2 n=1 Tax=Porites lutea TaxID=51062 RepID=UPI003CC679F1
MHVKKAHVLIVLLWKLMCFEADGEKACSCYTFESDQSMKWQQARASCKYNKKYLVAMETEREWQFITNALKNRTAKNNEWHIGLFRKRTVSNWTWVNGKPLTITKWRDSEPSRNSYYALIGEGKFDAIRGDIGRAWICEEETDITTLARTSSLSERKTAEKDSSTVVIVAASLGTVLFVALIALAALILLKRRRRHSSKDSEKPKKNALNQPENSYESVDPVEAAKLLGTGEVSLIKTEQVEYDMVNKKEDTKPKNREHVDLTEQAPPKMDHEYAVVNKKNRKQKKGDVLYAQLDMPESEDSGNNIKVRKPTPYAPTVYADVTPTEVINKAEPNSKVSTYENVQKTTIGV